MRLPKVLCYVLLVGIVSCNDDPKNQVKSGNAIEKIKLTSLDGEAIDLKKYNDKVVFVNFWATWCRPCVGEMPSIANVKNKLPGDKIVFLFATNEEKERVENFRSQHDYDFDYVIANNQEELNIMGLPTTLIFDKKGRLVFSDLGARKWDSDENIKMLKKIIN